MGAAATAPVKTPGLVWDWTSAALGALYALPAAVVILSDPSRGLALTVGVLPAAIVGLAPTRRRRVIVVVLGACVGVPMFIGGPARRGAGARGGGDRRARSRRGAAGAARATGHAGHEPVAADGRRRPQLQRPRQGGGHGGPDGGGLPVCLAGLDAVARAHAHAVSRSQPRDRRYRRSATGSGSARRARPPRRSASSPASSTSGWACAAALLVMRPTAEMQRLRSVGRIASVAIGAAAAVALIHLSPPAGVYSLAAIAAIAAAGATHRSRWYVTSVLQHLPGLPAPAELKAPGRRLPF